MAKLPHPFYFSVFDMRGLAAAPRFDWRRASDPSLQSAFAADLIKVLRMREIRLGASADEKSGMV